MRTVAQTIAGHPRLHPLYALAACGSAFCVIVVAATVCMLWHQYGVTINAASTNLANLSQAVADQTDRVIQSLEHAEDRLLDHMAIDRDSTTGEPMGMTASAQLQGVMRDVITGMSEAYALLLFDPRGNLVNSSNDMPIPPPDIADRAYFRFALAHPEIGTFISETVVGRQSHKPAFFVVRRLSGPNGAFKGLLLGAVQVEYLERLFAANTLAEGGSVALVRPDGTMLARYPSVPLEATQGRAEEFRRSIFGVDHGVVRRKGAFDGLERLTAVSGLPNHPLKVTVSQRFSAAVAAWRIEAAWMGGITALACLTTAVMVILAIRRLRDQQRLEAVTSAVRLDGERARADRAMSEQHARFGVALDNMSQGLLMFDHARCLLLANAAVLEIFDLPPGLLQPGMPFTDVVRAVGKVGSLSVDASTVIEFYADLVRQNVPAKFVLKVPSGRHLTAIFKPYDTGWLVTYEDVTEMRRADERILHMAMHDALTGLPNRVMLRACTDDAFAAVGAAGDGFAVMCLDLDHFKDVNDALGHPAGDALLCEVARRIQSVTRRSDTIVRLGGDEFAIIACPSDGAAAVATLASRLLEVIEAPYDIDGQTVFIGTSIGIAMAPADGTSPDTLMKNADLALYRAKSDGRGRFAFFESEMEQHLLDRRRVEVELRNALVLGELEMYYQPIVRVANRRIVGFEALMRWRHATRGMISPAEFIPIAEANGFIIQMGAWALNRACLEAARWPGTAKVAVNLSTVQFRDGNLIDTVAGALAASGLAASRLELEITESTMMQDTDATLAIITNIRALGVRVAMDDFGTGYSSLAYLQRFPFDKLKIDRAFVHDISQPTNLAIIRAVTSIAENMGIATTAEGIETEEQFARVADLGCSEAQGYLFSPARPASEIATMLRQTTPTATSSAAPVSNHSMDMAAI